MNLIRKEVITSLPVSLAYLFSITAAYAQTVQAFTLQNLMWCGKWGGREGGEGEGKDTIVGLSLEFPVCVGSYTIDINHTSSRPGGQQ